MSSSFLASRTLAKMNRLEGQLRTLAHHARTLQRLPSGVVDSRDLVVESNRLIRGLMEAADELGQAKQRGRRIRRGLPSRPPKSSGVGRYQYSGPPPAAAWGSEFAVAEKRFRRALGRFQRSCRPRIVATKPNGARAAMPGFTGSCQHQLWTRPSLAGLCSSSPVYDATENALAAAEAEVFKLQHSALQGLNKPNRTGSEPTAIFDAIMAFVEVLTAFVESRKK